MPNNLPMVEPFSAELESISNRMDAAGIGGHPSRGHAVTLRNIAADLRSQAALGRLPAVYESFNAAADVGDESGELAARRKGGALTLLEAVNAAGDDLTRRTALINLRARAERIGISLDDNTVITLPVLDAALAKSGASINDRFSLKGDLHRAGLLMAA